MLSGTDCLHVPHDADRSTRTTPMKNCGHQPGSKWSAWFNTGVMLFRATPTAIDIAQEWRDMMEAIKGEAQVGRPPVSSPSTDGLPARERWPAAPARGVAACRGIGLDMTYKKTLFV